VRDKEELSKDKGMSVKDVTLRVARRIYYTILGLILSLVTRVTSWYVRSKSGSTVEYRDDHIILTFSCEGSEYNLALPRYRMSEMGSTTIYRVTHGKGDVVELNHPSCVKFLLNSKSVACESIEYYNTLRDEYITIK
jgi:hypothetical protein